MEFTDIERNKLGWIMLRETNLSTRTIQGLKRNGILTVFDLFDKNFINHPVTDTSFRSYNYTILKQETLQLMQDVEKEGLQILYSKYGVSPDSFDLWDIMSAPRTVPGIFSYNISRNGLSRKLLNYLIFKKHIYTLESFIHASKNNVFADIPVDIKPELDAFVQKIDAYPEECSAELKRVNYKSDAYVFLKNARMYHLEGIGSLIDKQLWMSGFEPTIETFLVLASFKYDFSMMRTIGTGRKQMLDTFLQDFSKDGLMAIYHRFLPFQEQNSITNEYCSGENRDLCKLCRLYYFTCRDSFQSHLFFSDEKMDWFKEISLHDIGFSTRICNSLKRHRINNLQELIHAYNNQTDFSRMRNCGEKSVQEILAFREEIEKHGLETVKMRLDQYKSL